MTTSSMKAVRFHGNRDLRVDQIDIPKCGKGQVKVKPAWVGICGSDLHEYLGGPTIVPSTPHPITGESIPVTFGHEFSGVVEEVGAGVEHVKAGDRVCVEPIIYDSECGACKKGWVNCCSKNGFVGISGWGGGLSEHCVVPATSIIPIPESMSLEIGALIEPLAVGWHAVKASPFKPTDTVLVLGGGPIGLAVIQALRARAPHNTIIVSEVSPKRKEFAKHFGASTVLDPTKEDVVKRCREMSEGGDGVDVVFDAAGVQVAFEQGIEALKAHGTLVNIAVWEKGASFDPNKFLFKEIRYQGVATYVKGDFEEVIDAIKSGKMEPGSMITKKIKMNEVVEEGFMTLVKDKDSQVKILVEAGT